MEDLIGKTIRKVEKTPDGEYVRFTVADGSEIVYEAFGDCCSSSWVEAITLPTSLPQTVVDVDEGGGVEIPSSEHECLQVYKSVLRFASGESLHIEYRNSSNGYYGGSLDRIDSSSLIPEMVTVMQVKTQSLSPKVKRRIIL